MVTIKKRLKHTHLLLSAEVNRPIISEENAIQWIQSLVDDQQMQLLAPPIAAYSSQIGNRGLTICALITTSHIVAHFWDELTPARLELDVYTCGDFSLEAVLKLISELEPEQVIYKLLDRESNFQELNVD